MTVARPTPLPPDMGLNFESFETTEQFVKRIISIIISLVVLIILFIIGGSIWLMWIITVAVV